MQGYLITNAFMRGGSFETMRRLFMDAAANAGISLISKTNADLMGSIPDDMDFALFYDKDIRLAMRLEQKGVRVFNSADAIAVCDDKTLTHLTLEKAGLPQPEYLLCPHSFPGVGYGDMSFLKEAGKVLGWPLVIKEGCGSFGQQVYLAADEARARQILCAAGEKPIVFQKFIRECAGRDERLFVVGDRVIAAITRENRSGDFRANVENGGYPQAYAPTEEECALAVGACRALGLDFGGVDILPAHGGPLLCEVNSNAHFGGLKQVTGVNPAEHIIAHIRRSL